jgi:hypothetical protein
MKMEPYDPKSKRQALQRLQHYVAEDTLSGGYHRSDIKKVIDLIAELEAKVERLKKEAALTSLFVDGQKDQIDQLRRALDAVIELQLLKKRSKP